jgi:hypothetical protein
MSIKSTWQDEQLDENDYQIIRSEPIPQIPPINFPKLSVVTVTSGSPSETLADHSVLLTVKRLVVVVPNEDVDEAQLSRQIWNLAANYRLDVLLITIVANTDESMSARRRLTTIAAMTRASHFKVEKQVVFSHRWDRALRSFWQQSDMILCPAEKAIKNIFGKTTLLSQALSDHLQAPVYTFCGLYKPSTRQLPSWLRQLPFWLGFLIIVSIFFYFEANVDQSVHGWVGQTLLVMVMLIEIGFIYAWTLIVGKIK